MQLHFQTWGEGFPLVILHGLLGSSDNWQSIGKRLAQHFKVYAVDLRNHGQSPHHDVLDYSVMAEDLHEFFQRHNLLRAVLLGHSMGGKTAMQFAFKYPDLVEKLIVVDIAPRIYQPHHNLIFDALLGLDLNQLSTRTAADAALEPALPDLPTRQFLLKNLANDEQGGLKWKIPLTALYRNYPEIIKTPDLSQPFEKPTLFIRGGHSMYIRDVDAPEISRLFPHSKIVTIAKATHWVHADAPNEFLQIVFGFLQAQ